VRFLLDESADVRLKAHLLVRGHDVTSIVPDYRAGLSDPDVLAIAVREQRILITDDTDFGELVFRRQLAHAGIILYRLGRSPLDAKTVWLDHVLDRYAARLDQFLVITPRGIRIRRP
jgi:predicted nuclease of predicted toxin-antitoxin system